MLTACRVSRARCPVCSRACTTRERPVYLSQRLAVTSPEGRNHCIPTDLACAGYQDRAGSGQVICSPKSGLRGPWPGDSLGPGVSRRPIPTPLHGRAAWEVEKDWGEGHPVDW